jgi:hypothetical protein
VRTADVDRENTLVTHAQAWILAELGSERAGAPYPNRGRAGSPHLVVR